MDYQQLANLLALTATDASKLHHTVNGYYDKDNKAQCDELSKALRSMTAQDLAKVQNALKVIGERIELASKSLNVLYDVIRKNMLPIAMENQDLELFSVPDLGRVTLQSDIYIQLPAKHKEEFFDWLEEHQHGELIKSDVHHGTLKAWVKEYLKLDTTVDDYVSLPDYIKVTPYSFSKITKVAPKQST